MRLHRTPLYAELVGIIETFELLVAERKGGNSAAAVRVKYRMAAPVKGWWAGKVNRREAR